MSASRRPRSSRRRSGSPALPVGSERRQPGRLVLGRVGPRGSRHHGEERPAQDLHRLLAEERQVEAAGRGVGDPLERLRRRPPDQGAGERPGRLGAAAAEQLLHGPRDDPPLAVRQRRVEERQGVPEAPVGRPGEEAEGVRLHRVGRHLLLVQDLPERLTDLRARDRPEVEALAAREDRRGQAPRLGGGQHEDHVGRGLLERLEQGVEGGLRQHVDFVDDVDLAPPARRRVAGILAERPHLVDPAVRGAVDLEHVEGPARGHLAAGLARGAGHGAAGPRPLAVQAHRQEAGRGRLAHAPRAGEQVRVGDALLREGVPERPDDRRLTDDRLEGERPPAPREDLVGHRAPGARGPGPPSGKKKWPCTRRR